ncbi:transposase, partial [Rhodanobacter sp. FW510-R12]
MAMNLVQFQPGLSMVEFMQQYGTEAKCYRALYRSRWPQGFRCPACDERRRCRFRRGAQVYYQCRACGHRTTLLSGTILQATKLPLRTWMLAIHLLTSTKTDMAALELMYKAAWRVKHKIMRAMAEREAPRHLSGFVQIDDAYLGGKFNGGKPGCGSPNKQTFLIAVETDVGLEHPAHAVIEQVR